MIATGVGRLHGRGATGGGGEGGGGNGGCGVGGDGAGAPSTMHRGGVVMVTVTQAEDTEMQKCVIQKVSECECGRYGKYHRFRCDTEENQNGKYGKFKIDLP